MEEIPGFLKKYFWDVKFKDIDLEKKRVYILRRILEFGDEKAIRWMWENFRRVEVKNVLLNYRGYSKKSANFWALILDVPKDKVLCLKKHLLKGPKGIWPY